MAKIVHNDVLDAALAVIESNCDKLTICSRAPTTYTEANTTYALGDAVPTFTGPADGDVSGRKLTVDAISGADVDGSGNANHVALLDSGNSKLLYVTPCYQVRSNTAQAGAASAITLDAGASATDDLYNNCSIVKWNVDGNGNPINVETKLITDYVGATKVATVNSAWANNPTATSLFKIYGQQVTIGNTFGLDAWDIEIEDAAP
ncbi:hypothetical protein [Bremerella cremea]|uniref:hypothetical protein n=1 Tax=Bremerella cremea TaxID=1031537 RepID=UPI0031E5E8A2